MYTYSKSFNGTAAFTAAFNIIALALLHRNLVIAAAVMALSVVVDPPNLLAIIILSFYAAGIFRRKLPSLVLLLAPIVVSILFLMVYNFLLFQNPFTFPEQFWLGYQETKELTGPVNLLSRFSTPLHIGLFIQLLSPDYGLLFISPIILIGFLAFLMMSREFSEDHRKLIYMCYSVLLLMVIFYSLWWLPSGGASFGPRFLVGYFPFFIILLAVVLKSVKSTLGWIVLLFITAYSAVYAALGALYWPDKSFPAALEDIKEGVSYAVLLSMIGPPVMQWLVLSLISVGMCAYRISRIMISNLQKIRIMFLN